ncbi:MAG: DUF202 domain-containing protein [Nitrosospira sp.]
MDVRIFFAAERTLLAWVRTGLTVMAFGFVVARFGLFLTLLTAAPGGTRDIYSHWLSDGLGVTLVLTGSVIIMGALHNHRHFISSLPPEAVAKMDIPWLVSFLAISIALVGILLSVYLMFT